MCSVESWRSLALWYPLLMGLISSFHQCIEFLDWFCLFLHMTAFPPAWSEILPYQTFPPINFCSLYPPGLVKIRPNDKMIALFIKAALLTFCRTNKCSANESNADDWAPTPQCRKSILFVHLLPYYRTHALKSPAITFGVVSRMFFTSSSRNFSNLYGDNFGDA